MGVHTVMCLRFVHGKVLLWDQLTTLPLFTFLVFINLGDQVNHPPLPCLMEKNLELLHSIASYTIHTPIHLIPEVNSWFMLVCIILHVYAQQSTDLVSYKFE